MEPNIKVGEDMVKKKVEDNIIKINKNPNFLWKNGVQKH